MLIPVDHEREPASDESVHGLDRSARTAAIVIAVSVSVLSLPFLGAFAWIYRVFVHGLSGGATVSEITVDYVVIGVIYVSVLTMITIFGSRARLRSLAKTRRLLLPSIVAYAIPVIAFGMANVVIEVGDANSDGLVASVAGVASMIGPWCAFALLLPRAKR